MIFQKKHLKDIRFPKETKNVTLPSAWLEQSSNTAPFGFPYTIATAG